MIKTTENKDCAQVIHEDDVYEMNMRYSLTGTQLWLTIPKSSFKLNSKILST